MSTNNIIKGYLLEDAVDQFGRILLKKGMPLDWAFEKKLKSLNIAYKCTSIGDNPTNLFDEINAKIIRMPDKVDPKFDSITSIAVNKALNYMNDLFWKLNTDDFFKNSLGSLRNNNSVYTHCINVSVLATALGRAFNLSEKKLQNLSIAALFHDIGMTLICNEMTITEAAKLFHIDNTSNNELYKQHTIIGANLLKSDNLPSDIYNAIAQHHERYDGKGFPNNLSGNDIDINSMIISVCNTFDLLTTAGVESDCLTPQDALSKILKYNGTLYDPKVVGQFFTLFKFN